MGANRFDLGGLFSAVAVERERRGLSWAELSRQVGVAASTIRRMADADDAEADGVLALIRWLGVTPESSSFPHNHPTACDGCQTFGPVGCVVDSGE